MADAALSPIFIVGSPRSGTTLMRQIMDRHPSIAICAETHFLPLVYARRRALGDLSDAANRQRLIEDYIVSRPIRKAGLNTPELAGKLAQEGTSYPAMFAAILRYYAEATGKRRCGEKTPRHALHLKTLWDWFPDARILHMVRDPRASVASLMEQPWAPSSVVVNARRWLKINLAARSFRGHEGYLEVRYETLVSDPAGEVQRVCEFLGEEYSPAMLVPEDTPDPNATSRGRSRKAITPGRLEVWREDLTAAQIAQIEWVLGSRMEQFGYKRESPPASALTVLRGLGYAPVALTRFQISRLPAAWYRFVAPEKLAKYDEWTGPRVWRKTGKQTEKQA